MGLGVSNAPAFAVGQVVYVPLAGVVNVVVITSVHSSGPFFYYTCTGFETPIYENLIYSSKEEAEAVAQQYGTF